MSIETAKLDFRCQTCQQDLEASQELAGRSFVCPACKSDGVIPHLQHLQFSHTVQSTQGSPQFQMATSPANTSKAQETGTTASVTLELEKARLELLELSTRNRLLSVPLGSKSARLVEITDEVTTELFRILIQENRTMTFLPVPENASKGGPSDDEGSHDVQLANDLPQPEDEGLDERGIARRHADNCLQTRLTSPQLQKRLLAMFYDARTIIEEQGVNILYLAVGMLRWFESDTSEVERFAPLLLIPVNLGRKSATDRFMLSWTQDDVAENLSLAAKLKADFGILMPPLPDFDSFSPQSYLDAVAAAVEFKKGWEVRTNEATLGFFSFAKYLMYRDLDANNWPIGARIDTHDLVRRLLRDGFEPDPFDIDEDSFIDPQVPPDRLLHVVDADSFQTMAIEATRSGRNLVIQGPPGTGKSQTIVNIIAAAVADGKTVLFVAEKMAALEVVKRRLDNEGLGHIALELHSSKANKRNVLEELRRTKELGITNRPDLSSLLGKLQLARDALNSHAERLHRRFTPSGMTVFDLYGMMERLRQEGFSATDINLSEAKHWTAAERAQRQSILSELSECIANMGTPVTHPWRGVRLSSILPHDVDRLMTTIDSIRSRLRGVVSTSQELAVTLAGHEYPTDIYTARRLATAGHTIAKCPATDRAALASECWTDSLDDISSLVAAGERYVTERDRCQEDIARRTNEVRNNAHLLIASCRTLRDGLDVDAPDTAAGGRSLAALTDALAAIPSEADRFALSSPVWASDAESLLHLVETGRHFTTSIEALEELVREEAWKADAVGIRTDLAEAGGSILRGFKPRYRRARRSVAQMLTPIGVKRTKALNACLAVLNNLIAAQKCRRILESGSDLGIAGFGSIWRGESSDWGLLDRTREWHLKYGSLDGLSHASQRIVSLPSLIEAARTVRAEIEPMEQRIASIAKDLEMTLGDLVGSDSPADTKWSAVSERLADPCVFIDAYLELQPDTVGLRAQDFLGMAGFGTEWEGVDSDFAALRAIVSWHRDAVAEYGPEIGNLCRFCTDPVRAGTLSATLSSGLLEFEHSLAGLFSSLDIDCDEAFAKQGPSELPFTTLDERLNQWTEQRDELSRWINYRSLAQKANEIALSSFIDRLVDGRLSHLALVPTFEMAYVEAILRDLFAREPEIARFDGTLHDRLVRDFQNLDRQRMVAAKLQVAARHSQGIPQVSAGIGPMGVLNGEMAKKRRHLAIRQLVEQAGPAIQALKPVMMMSPLSVAQYLKPGVLGFDVMIIDEASQVQPVDALGAVARCSRLVVVGDEKQLPPTRFFSRMTGDVNEGEDDVFSAGDVESILGLCQAKGLPKRMLRWHYRSKHQSLIAVSNREYYENKLFIVPSPWTQTSGMGLVFHHLPNAVYDRGSTATNPAEARLVAAAVIRHAREAPDLSLGVATFSVKQRQCILDELELQRRASNDMEEFFNTNSGEPFFVKNLENVQGDERDVIFISVCYGRDSNGYMTMNFGPLSSEGGERRLNVLISRARRSCEVFSSITAEDIDLERGRSKGTAGLKLFLHFARTGRLDMAAMTDRGCDSPFEEHVAAALRSHGFEVRNQIGQSGFFIDMAIVDPEMPGRFVLGIECDGASYHSTRSSRDRDRLRQSVLEAHGWTMHRIWSTDWFHRPNQELSKVIAAYEAARANLRSITSTHLPRHAPPSLPPLPVLDVADESVCPVKEAPPLAIPYQEASFSVPWTTPLHEVNVAEITDVVVLIVEMEGPIHGQEIVARVRSLWGLERAGARIQSAVQKGLLIAERRKLVSCINHIYSIAGRPPPIRDRSGAASPSLRKPEYLPGSEIRAAALALVKQQLGATRDQLIVAVARLLGFRATSQQLRNIIDRQIASLVADKILIERGGYLLSGDSTVAGESSAAS